MFKFFFNYRIVLLPLIAYQVIFLSGISRLFNTTSNLYAYGETASQNLNGIIIIDFGGKVPEESIRKSIVVSVRNSFSSFSKIKPVPEDIIIDYLQERLSKDKSEAKRKIKKAHKLLRYGKKAYQRLKFQEALERFDRAKKGFIANLNELTSNKALLESYLYLGMTYSALGQTEDAYSEFRKALYLDPKKHLSLKDYPPSIVKTFEKAKQDISSLPGGTLLIDTVPSGCEVYVNGKKIGPTPINATYPVGEYFFKIAKEGYKSWYELVSVEDKINSLDVELDPFIADEELIMSLKPVEDISLMNQDSKSLLKDISRKLSGPIILLGWIERDARDILFAQLYDTRTETLTPILRGGLGKNFSGIDKGASKLVSDLDSFIDSRGFVFVSGDTVPKKIPLFEKPKPPTKEEIRKAKKANWWRKWWVWALIGGAVAGSSYGLYKGLQPKGGISVDNSGNF